MGQEGLSIVEGSVTRLQQAIDHARDEREVSASKLSTLLAPLLGGIETRELWMFSDSSGEAAILRLGTYLGEVLVQHIHDELFTQITATVVNYLRRSAYYHGLSQELGLPEDNAERRWFCTLSLEKLLLDTIQTIDFLPNIQAQWYRVQICKQITNSLIAKVGMSVVHATYGTPFCKGYADRQKLLETQQSL